MHTDEIQFTADFRCVEKLASFYLTLPQKAWSVAEDFGDTLKREGEVRPSRNCEEGAQGMRTGNARLGRSLALPKNGDFQVLTSLLAFLS
jgi:hypothetical protein